jgi:hypothetical protein
VGGHPIAQRLLDAQTTDLRDDVALVVAQIAGGGNGRLHGERAVPEAAGSI